MDTSTPFKWRHFQSEIILLCVPCYLWYPLCYRDLEEMMLKRGLYVDHTTIYRSRATRRARTRETLPTLSQGDKRLVVRR